MGGEECASSPVGVAIVSIVFSNRSTTVVANFTEKEKEGQVRRCWQRKLQGKEVIKGRVDSQSLWLLLCVRYSF